MTTNEAHAPALNTLAYAILELLERKSLSGYDVKKRFLGSLAFGWHAHVSQLYPTLRQLEHKGLVTSRTEASNQGPARRIYSITPEGHATLLDWLRSPLDDTQQSQQHGHRRSDHTQADRLRNLRVREIREQLRQWDAQQQRQ